MLVTAEECEMCENHIEPHQGPPTPPRYVFTVKEAAAALVAVAQGESYTQAAETARLRAGRPPMGNGYGAQLVANWVETLTPIVTARAAETQWPETIVCDSTNFIHTNRHDGSRSQTIAVMAVWGYEAGKSKGRLWALHASHRATARDWLETFDLLDGMPSLIVSDDSPSIHNAAKLKWPQQTPRTNWSTVGAEPFVFFCEHHRRENAAKPFEFYGLDQDKQAVATFEKAFRSPQSWAAFRRLAAGYIQLDAWCAGVDAQLRAQSSWRSRLPGHRANGAAEMALQEVRRVIGRRDWSLRNKYRTNQMLELVRVRINRQADPAVFARALRTHLETGVTPGRQLACVDVGTMPRIANRQPGQVIPRPSLRV